eukprot:1403415-Prymnesium_polylepis.1
MQAGGRVGQDGGERGSSHSSRAAGCAIRHGRDGGQQATHRTAGQECDKAAKQHRDGPDGGASGRSGMQARAVGAAAPAGETRGAANL